MKKVRLNQSQLTRWRSNRFALLDEATGEFVRYATQDESIQATEASKRQRTIKVRENGRLMNFRADRERLKEELLLEHGQTVNAHDRTGRRLFVAQTFIPTVEPHATPEAPHPNRCQCSEWKGRPDGKHHPQCPLNDIAPEAHRAGLGDIELGANPPTDTLSDTEPPTAPEVSETPQQTLETAAAIETSELPPAPGDCECARWRMPAGQEREPNQHHPACPHDEVWREHSGGELPHFLFTMSGTLLRRATAREKNEAVERLRTKGMPTVVLGSEEFLCLTEAP